MEFLQPMFVLFVFSLSNAVFGQSYCTTPSQEPGQCILITGCPTLLSLLQNRSRSKSQTEFLRDSQCGAPPKSVADVTVCCPSISASRPTPLQERPTAPPVTYRPLYPQRPTPPRTSNSCTAADGTSGICVDLNNCQSLKSLFDGPKPLPAETISFLRRSTCKGPARFNVCCGVSRPPPTTEAPVTNQNRIEPTVNVDHLLPNPNECGEEAGEDRIVGGEATNIDQYPWMALVEYKNSRGSISLGCGATLISKRYVITAGHCVFGAVLTQLGTPINIRLGEYDKSTLIDCVQVPGGQDCNEEPVTIGIEEIISHPDYQPSRGTEMNDIAVIRLANDAPYTDFIRPICLPKSDITTQANVSSIVAGWGATESEKSSNVKLHLQVPLVSLAICQAAYMNPKTPRLHARLWDKQLCAGGQAGKDSCRGDSGGPLMVVEDTKVPVQWTLHGVVSFGPTPCALPNMPGVYSKVFSYLNWIKAQIRE